MTLNYIKVYIDDNISFEKQQDHRYLIDELDSLIDKCITSDFFYLRGNFYSQRSFYYLYFNLGWVSVQLTPILIEYFDYYWSYYYNGQSTDTCLYLISKGCFDNEIFPSITLSFIVTLGLIFIDALYLRDYANIKIPFFLGSLMSFGFNCCSCLLNYWHRLEREYPELRN